ncbi:MAG: MerR family DNA-binding transcriptional regulator [Gammaproteobacteria bacterium]|nr:MerR family DNA-binding transcriptional regulator [Gammaproteobacteria bacterium]
MQTKQVTKELSRSYNRKLYSISDLSQEFDLTTRAIRFYEDAGLLTPVRQGRNRYYTLRERTRLKLILHGKRLGFTLNEIGEMFRLYDSKPGELAQLRHIMDKINEKMSLLERQLEDIQIVQQELQEFRQQCQTQLEQMGDC